MKIKTYFTKRTTLEEFTRQHDLTMLVYERSPENVAKPLPRYYCCLEYIEVKEGSMLISLSGNANTVYEAIADYCNQISGKSLVYRATSPEHRREFVAPLIEPRYEHEEDPQT